MAISSKDFKKISIRGRVAYAICCLENTMQRFNIYGDGWNLLLEKLWSFTTLPSEIVPLKEGGVEFVLERWYNINVYFPHQEHYYGEYTYQDYCLHFDNYPFYKTPPTEAEYNILRKDYIKTNNIIDELCRKIFRLGTCELWAGLDNISQDTLNKLQEIIDYMYLNNIQLPDVAFFQKYEYSPKGIDEDSYGWGYVFNGKNYSKFIK